LILAIGRLPSDFLVQMGSSCLLQSTLSPTIENRSIYQKPTPDVLRLPSSASSKSTWRVLLFFYRPRFFFFLFFSDERRSAYWPGPSPPPQTSWTFFAAYSCDSVPLSLLWLFVGAAVSFSVFFPSVSLPPFFSLPSMFS